MIPQVKLCWSCTKDEALYTVELRVYNGSGVLFKTRYYISIREWESVDDPRSKLENIVMLLLHEWAEW